ncbi:MAG: extracellular solute-binding protein, partial [Chloroflexi bacterium]|nr:extracellular solute-binding protein [Chloroflexota bacterium]
MRIEESIGVRVSRRKFIAWTAGAAVVALLQACAPAAAPTPTKAPAAPPKPDVATPTPTPAPPKAKVVVEQWFNLGGAQAEHVEKITAKFNQQFPHIEVKTTIVLQADLPTKLATVVAAASPPDIAHMGGASIISMLIDGKHVEPLDKFRPDIATLDWLEPLKKVLIREGRMYSVPVNSGVLGLY